jgi:hypothetical protein
MVHDIPEYSFYFGCVPLPININKLYVSDGGSASKT